MNKIGYYKQNIGTISKLVYKQYSKIKKLDLN